MRNENIKEKQRISKEQVKNIADLARIKITDQEAEKLEKDFEEILLYFGKLEQTSAKERSHMFIVEPPLREDKSSKCGNESDIINQFSVKKGNYARAPKALK
jgi:aspartyl-tRNA(Asn)/glutamyl-tRNA(Gln) amidotransferase subunit C